MSNTPNPRMAEVAECMRRSLQQVLEIKGRRPAVPVSDFAVLFGAPDALLDSLSLVMFFAELEQELERRWGVSVDLFAGLLDEDDGAQTLRTLTLHILSLLSSPGRDSGLAVERDLQ